MSPLLVLIVAVLATSYAGPIVRFAAAPALAIAFWRLALVLPVTGGLAVLEGSREQGAGSSVTRQHLLPAPRSLLPLMTLSGLLLALHFWSWIASLRFTTVASSVVLVSLKPVFAWGIAALWLREHPGRAERWGIVLAVLGASLIGLGDARLSLGALSGDGRGLLRDRPPRAADGRDLALRHGGVRGGGGGAGAVRPGPHHTARGIRAPGLGGVRRDGGGPDAGGAHRHELRAAPFPRDHGERGGAGRAGGSERDRVAGPRDS